MKKHRLLAIGRAPLAARIHVLRQIADLDIDNEVWETDLATYEQAELKQLSSRAKAAYEAKDSPALAACYEQANSDAWRTTPSPVLIEKVTGLYTTMRRKKARKELMKVETLLNQAHAAFDVTSGCTAREHWNELLPIANLADNHELVLLAQPALDWLEEVEASEKREINHQIAIGELEAELDEGYGDRAELERLYHAVRIHDQPVPAIVEQRYRERLGALELTTVHRRRMLVAATAIVLSAISVGLWWKVSSDLLAGEIQQRTAVLADLIERQQLDQADSYLTQLRSDSPKVAGSPAIGELSSTLAAKQQEEADRAAAFDRMIESVRAPGLGDTVKKPLSQANDLARTEDEKAQVAQLELTITTLREEKQAQLDEKVLQELSLLSNTVAQWDKSGNATREEIKQIESKLLDLSHQRYEISPTVYRQVDVVRKRLSTVEKVLENRLQQQHQIARMTDSVQSDFRNMTAFAGELRSYSVRYPGTSRGSDFRQSLNEEKHWKGLAARNNFR